MKLIASLPAFVLVACSTPDSPAAFHGPLAPFASGLSRREAVCATVPRAIARLVGLMDGEQCWDSARVASFVLTRGDTLWSIEQTTFVSTEDTSRVLSETVRQLETRLGRPERCGVRLWLWRRSPDLYAAVFLRPGTDAPRPGDPHRFAIVHYLHVGPVPKEAACPDSAQ